jgi:serine phosphatase RsbU (regulator of sigma subunit)
VSGALEIANAGLPDPYLLSTRKIEALTVPGPRLPLGARDEMVYDSLRVAVAPEESVLFVTDGLPEAPTSAGEPLGYEQFGRLVAGAYPASANFLEVLVESVRAATLEPMEDDWTALLLERRS